MVTIGLITEGITDQIVIENILMGYFDQNEDDIEFKELQPLRDNTDESQSPLSPSGLRGLNREIQE